MRCSTLSSSTRKRDAPNEVLRLCPRGTGRRWRPSGREPRGEPPSLRGGRSRAVRMLDEIEAGGAELGAIYHSHTRSEPYPSQTDVNFSGGWPGVEWIIVGLLKMGRPVVRSDPIDAGEVREVEARHRTTLGERSAPSARAEDQAAAQRGGARPRHRRVDPGRGRDDPGDAPGGGRASLLRSRARARTSPTSAAGRATRRRPRSGLVMARGCRCRPRRSPRRPRRPRPRGASSRDCSRRSCSSASSSGSAPSCWVRARAARGARRRARSGDPDPRAGRCARAAAHFTRSLYCGRVYKAANS